MKLITTLILLSVILLSAISDKSFAQEEVAALENRVAQLERQVKSQSAELSRLEEIATNVAPLAFLFGAFCALWAQNTGRNAWLWFFMGAIFNIITVLFLLGLHKRPEY